MMRAMGIRLLLITLVSTPVYALGLTPARLQPGPTLSLPWAEHGRLSEVTGRAPIGWSQEAYVVPQRPGRNLVRYFDYHWRDHDYLDDDGSAGLRLYFYDREYPLARIAGGAIPESRRLPGEPVPDKTSVKGPLLPL